MLHQVMGRLREQNLACVSGVHNAGSVMYIQANVAFRSELWLACMQADARQHDRILGPIVGGQSMLDSHGCPSRVDGAGKDDKEGIALCIDLIAVPLPKCSAHNLAIIGEQTGVLIAQLLHQMCGFCHVSEEHRQGPCWQIFRRMAWLGPIWLAVRGSLLWLWWQQAQFAGAFAEELAEFLYIVGAGPGGAAFPACDIEIQRGPDAIGDISLRPAAFQPSHAQQVIRGGLFRFFGHDSSNTWGMRRSCLLQDHQFCPSKHLMLERPQAICLGELTPEYTTHMIAA